MIEHLKGKPRQFVGSSFDLVSKFRPLCAQRALRAQETPSGETLPCFLPLLRRPPASGLEQDGVDLLGHREEDERFESVEPDRRKKGDMGVAPVLAQARRRLPQRSDPVDWPRHVAIGREERLPGAAGVVDRCVERRLDHRR